MQTQRKGHALRLPGTRARIGASATMRSAALSVAAALWLVLPVVGRAQPAGTTIAFIAERKVAQLPDGPLFWRVETFPSGAAAQAAAGPTGLVGEMDDRVWLFTLGPSGGASPGGTHVAEVGPLPIRPAAEYLIQVQGAITPPGGASQVHTHPGLKRGTWWLDNRPFVPRLTRSKWERGRVSPALQRAHRFGSSTKGETIATLSRCL